MKNKIIDALMSKAILALNTANKQIQSYYMCGDIKVYRVKTDKQSKAIKSVQDAIFALQIVQEQLKYDKDFNERLIYDVFNK